MLDELHGVRCRFGFAHHAKFVAAAQDGLDAVAHDLVIIHEEDVNAIVDQLYRRLGFREPAAENGDGFSSWLSARTRSMALIQRLGDFADTLRGFRKIHAQKLQTQAGGGKQGPISSCKRLAGELEFLFAVFAS